MKIIVCSQNRKEVTGHAGKCRKFWLYDIENDQVKSKELIELAIEHSLHAIGHNPEHAAFEHPAYSSDIFISGGMGFGLVRRLQSYNTQAIVTPEKNPDKAVEDFLNGTLLTGSPHQGGHHHH